MGDLWTTITTDTAIWDSSSSDVTLILGNDWNSPPAKRKKKKKNKPETALAWLDRRVDEMRLAL